MSAAFIGGNLDAMSQAATRLTASGDKAIATTASTETAAVALNEAIETAMGELIRKFNDIAEELRIDINEAHTQLSNADWQGASRENALQIKSDLLGQVNTVLTNATGSLEAEQSAFVGRATDLLAQVKTEFGGVMTQVQGQYAALADASEKTRANLEAADQTIRMG